MPIYGYACTHCGHSLDALQKIADDPLTDCPECETPNLRRQLSAPRFRLKGQGWYETDFKKDNQRNIAGEKEPAKADDKSASTSADAPKTEAKAETKPAPTSSPTVEKANTADTKKPARATPE